MSLKIEILTKEKEEEYSKSILKDSRSFLLSTLKYRDLIEEVTKSEPRYIILLKDNKIVASLPTFIKRGKEGSVLNSMPWYGSNPGISVDESLSYEERYEIKTKIISSFHDLAKKEDCFSSCLITRPFEKDICVFDNSFTCSFIDSRIGMFTKLPNYSDNISNDLMKIVHSKTRNLIRKSENLNIEFYHSNSTEDLLFLSETHKKNMQSVNASFKDFDFFLKFSKIFKYDDDYRIYIAKIGNMKIAALLISYFNKTVEYFTPAIDVNYRSYNPLNLLIFNAMKDMSSKEFVFWNWGGTTLPGMEGVYHFKNRWGSMECNYYYFITFYKDLEKVKRLTKDFLLKEYEFFYLVPFSELC